MRLLHNVMNSDKFVILKNLCMIIGLSLLSHASEYVYRKYCHSFTLIGYFTSVFFSASDTCQHIRSVTISCTYMIRHTIPLLAYNVYCLVQNEFLKHRRVKSSSNHCTTTKLLLCDTNSDLDSTKNYCLLQPNDDYKLETAVHQQDVQQ